MRANRIVLMSIASIALLSLTGSGCGGDSKNPPDVEQATRFQVQVENVSAHSALPTPFAPGLYAVHEGDDPLFDVDHADRGHGLESLAEDGDPGILLAAVREAMGVAASGAFDTPEGAGEAGVLLPGQTYSFEFEASPKDGKLSLASMLVQSNDVFAGSGPGGIDLFDDSGQPLAERDVTDQLWLWDAGTEEDEAPGIGPNQAPRQGMANQGAAEGVIRRFANATRALPLASGLVSVGVTQVGDGFEFRVTNISADRGLIDTPIAPVFWALHDGGFSLFTEGQAASAGLEELAEDGSPAGLVATAAGLLEVGDSGAAAIPEGGMDAGPIANGQAYTFMVTPSHDFTQLSLAAMVVQSNDAFIAINGQGVALTDGDGNLRSADHVAADIERMLAVWDAGTEANEVPGVGLNQPMRQAAANTGPADPDAGVRLYRDHTNDLSGEWAGGFIHVSVINSADAGTFELRIENTSHQTAYPGLLTPVVWQLSDGSHGLFGMGQAASAGLERLSEDGDGSELMDELMATGADVGQVAVPEGGADAGPIAAGQAYSVTLDVTAAQPVLNLATMVVPSNDTFIALGETGVRLLTEQGTPRSDSDIAADIQASLSAYDAGSEANQAGASGPDQAPHQAMAGAGAPEGDGTVRSVDANLWPFPDVSSLIRVTITPIDE